MNIHQIAVYLLCPPGDAPTQDYLHTTAAKELKRADKALWRQINKLNEEWPDLEYLIMAYANARALEACELGVREGMRLMSDALASNPTT